MNRGQRYWTWVWVTAALVGVAEPALAESQFTYQGQLKHGPDRAQGEYDLQFILWDASSNGIQVGPTLCGDNVMVVDGLFTVDLNFGQTAWNGEPRWLEVGARTGGASGDCGQGQFTGLLPLQPVNAAPYALHALSAPVGHALDAPDGSPTNAVFVDDAGKVGVGTTTPSSSLQVNGGLRARGGAPGAVGANNNGYAFSGSGGDNDSGMFSSADGTVEFYTDAVERMRIIPGGSVGIGTTSPESRLEVAGEITLDPPTGNSILTFNRGNAEKAQIYVAGTSDSLDFKVGPWVNMTITSAGDVGIGTSSPQSTLDVRGPVRLGWQGELSAVGAAQDARMTFGVVSLTGTLLYGSGVTATRLDVGKYQVTFSPAYYFQPAFTVTPVNPAGTERRAFAKLLSDTQAEVWITNAAGALTDAPFSFIAMGTR